MQIIDGKGSGRAVEVDVKNRIRTFATIQEHIAAHARSGEAYSIGFPPRTLTLTGGRVIWFKNNNPDYDFLINKIFIFWNGGSTNHNRCVYITAYKDDDEPSANHTEVSAGNLNFGTTQTALATSYYWDEVGDGMTVVSGTPFGFMIMSQGVNLLDVASAVVVPYGTTLSLNAQPEEVGELSIIISGCYCQCGMGRS